MCVFKIFSSIITKRLYKYFLGNECGICIQCQKIPKTEKERLMMINRNLENSSLLPGKYLCYNSLQYFFLLLSYYSV